MNDAERKAYDMGYRDGESSLLADVNTLCDQLDIDVGDRHEFEAIRAEIGRLRGAVAHVEEAVTIAIVMLAGIGDVWAELDYPERCARAENELRALLDHVGGQ